MPFEPVPDESTRPGSPPDESSTPSSKREQAPPRAWRKQFVAAGVAVVVLVTAIGVFVATRPDDAPSAGTAWVLWATDLPSGLDQLWITLAGATVGDDCELTLDQVTFDLAAHRGKADALRIASGTCPPNPDRADRLSLVFANVEGGRAGARVPVELPENRITLVGLPPGDYGRTGMVLDFNLDDSLREKDGKLVFEPFVERSYYYTDTETSTDLGLDEILDQLLEKMGPDQFRDALAEDIVDRLCQRINGGCDEAAPSPSASPPSGTSRPPPSPSASAPPGTDRNPLPNIPINPGPAHGYRQIPLATTLTWQGGDPLGEVVRYQVIVNGAEKCGATTVVQCAVAGLEAGRQYKWKVRATDAVNQSSDSQEWEFTTNFYPDAASTPTPSHDSTDRPISLTLRWSGSDPDGNAGLTYRVLLKRSADPLTTDERCGWTSDQECAVSGLSQSTWYHWQVETKDSQGLTQLGPVWKFKTSGGGQGDGCQISCGGLPG